MTYFLRMITNDNMQYVSCICIVYKMFFVSIVPHLIHNSAEVDRAGNVLLTLPMRRQIRD